MIREWIKARTGLNRHGVREILRSPLSSLLQLGVLLLAAGRADWFQAWFYTGLYWLLAAVYAAVMIKTNPELLNARGRFPADTKPFDRRFFQASVPLIFIACAVAGLDAGRFGWTAMAWPVSVAGAVVTAAAFLFSLWAMMVNPHFEGTVRIQKNRSHQVCDRGPYRWIRHPGYVSWILITLSAAPVLGSGWALIPSLVIAVLIVVRTALEDRVLHRELPGYAEYAARVRWRLVPGIW